MASQQHTEKDFLTCSICLDILKEPKTLSCMHRFCQSCLHNHIISTVTTSAYTRSFSCPLCRVSISAPNFLSSPSSWASQLKTDFYVKGLIEVLQSRKEEPESYVTKIKYPKCQKHADKECGFYCMDCSETSCETCAVVSHRACNQLLTVEDAAKERRATMRSQISQISARIGEALELECQREGYMRHVEDQKAHIEQKIRESADKLHQLVASQEETLLKHLERNYDGLQDKVSLQVSTFEDTVNKARLAVKSASSKLMSPLDFDLMSDNSCFVGLAECDIVNATNKHTRFCKKLSEVKCFFQKHSVPDITLGKTAIYYNLSADEIPSTSNPSKDNGVSSRNSATAPFLPQKPELLSYAAICTGDKPQGGQVKACAVNRPIEAPVKSSTGNMAREELHKTATSDKPQEPFPSLITPGNTGMQSTKVIRTIKTRLHQDRQKPSLNSLVVVGSTCTVLVTDWINKSVKVFPNKRGKSTSLTLDCHPWAITQVSETLAAVSLPSSCQICFIKVSPVPSIDRYIKVCKSYQALTSFTSFDSVMLVAGSCQNFGAKEASVDFLTNSGQVLKSFINDSSGLPLFSDPAYLCMTPDKLIIICDVGHKTVKYVTLEGELKFKFPPEGAAGLRNPKGVACDPSGGVVVVEDGDLLALTADGQLRKTLTTCKDSRLCISGTLAMDKNGHLYLVDNDEDIKVLKIEWQ